MKLEQGLPLRGCRSSLIPSNYDAMDGSMSCCNLSVVSARSTHRFGLERARWRGRRKRSTRGAGPLRSGDLVTGIETRDVRERREREMVHRSRELCRIMESADFAPPSPSLSGFSANCYCHYRCTRFHCAWVFGG